MRKIAKIQTKTNRIHRQSLQVKVYIVVVELLCGKTQSNASFFFHSMHFTITTVGFYIVNCSETYYNDILYLYIHFVCRCCIAVAE